MTIFRFIDFEYNSSSEPRFNLVSYAERAYNSSTKKSRDRVQWLYGQSATETPPSPRGVFVAFNVVAEASALYSWGVDPTEYRWIDLQAEYRMLTNHWDKYRYGKQLIKGKEVKTFNPRQKQLHPKRNYSKPETSLAAAIYKLLGEKIDTEYKDEIRRKIISNRADEILSAKEEIMLYNMSDVTHLHKMLQKVVTDQKSAGVFNFDQMLERGSSVAHTALMTMRGYPINHKYVWNFAQSVGEILKDTQEHINSQFEEYTPFRWDKKLGRYSMNTKQIKAWIEEKSGMADRWPLTQGGDYSLSLKDAWSVLYAYRSPYPENDYAAQIYRFLRLKESVNGFLPRSTTAPYRDNFFSSVGADHRVRPYLNPYGAQSSRFQPKATGFLPLKSSWMRCFIEPGKGQAICGIDYKSQEFLIAALLSNDAAMIASYESGDVYADFATRAGALTDRVQEPDRKRIRNKFKSTVLGIQYLMGPESLARKLTADTGELHTKSDAEELIGLFREVYHVFDEWRQSQISSYNKRGKIQLVDGWTMFGDNPNFRSVANMPVQGTGAVVLRRAIKLCHESGLKPIIPLHDALYIEYPAWEFLWVDRFAQVMHQAFIETLDHPKANIIKLDVYSFSKEYPDREIIPSDNCEIQLMPRYVEGRSEDEYNRFKKYFERKKHGKT